MSEIAEIDPTGLLCRNKKITVLVFQKSQLVARGEQARITDNIRW